MFQYHDLLSERFTAKVYDIYEQTTYTYDMGSVPSLMTVIAMGLWSSGIEHAALVLQVTMKPGIN